MRYTTNTLALTLTLTLAFTACAPEVTVVERPCTVEQTAGGAKMMCPGEEPFLFRDAAQGSNAQSFSYIVEATELEAGGLCSSGGSLVRVGRDDDNDGVLDDDEEVSRQAICAGEEGADGAQVIVERTELPRRGVCFEGGTRLVIGTDVDRDGSLSEDEIDLTSEICATSVNVCTADHIILDDGICVPFFSMELEAVVTSSTLDASSALPAVALGDAVVGTLVYEWERGDSSPRTGLNGRGVLVYPYEPGELVSSWSIGAQTFEGSSSGELLLGDYDVTTAGMTLTAGALLDSDGAPTGIGGYGFDASRAGLSLESYRPMAPELLDSLAPFELTFTDATRGELTVEVRSVARLDALP